MLSSAPFPRSQDCRELTVQSPEARLFQVNPTDGGPNYWRAEMPLSGDTISRRFASEAHARWWIAALDERRSVPSIYEFEERMPSLRSATAS